MGICCMTQGTQSRCSVITLRRVGERGRGVRVGREAGVRFKREGTYVYPWLIHVDVWLLLLSHFSLV